MLSSRDKVQSGQRWEPRTAAQHNAWTDAAQAIAQLNRSSLIQSKQGLEYTPIFIEAASTIPPGTVVGFGNPNLLASNNETAMQRVVFDYATPTAGRWAVAQKGIGTSEFEECVLTGIAWAQVNVTDATHTHADIDAGALKSATSGYAKILYKPGGTGTSWCCLQLGCCGAASEAGNGVSKQCFCGLVQTMLEDMSLTTPAQDGLRAIWTGCNCGTACSSCDNGIAASEYQLAITGMPAANPYVGSISNACWDAIVAWIETPRTAVPSSCELLFDFGTLTCEGDDYTFLNNVSPNGIKVYLANKLPQPLSNPAKQVYKNGTHSPALMPAFSIDTITTSTNCLDERSWTETTASTLFGVPVTFTLTPM